MDIRSLESQKTSFQQAKVIFQRWGAYEGACTAASCVFDIHLQNISVRSWKLFRDRPWLMDAFLLLGGHPAEIVAQVTVRDGLVWGKQFAVMVQSTGNPIGQHYSIYASGQTVSRVMSQTHYEISAPGGCLNCVAVTVNFTPEAQPNDVSRLLAFDFSCLTRLRACRSPADLMPNAWAERLDMTARYCVADIESQIRQAQNVGIFEVSESTTEACGSGVPCDTARSRLSERLRGSSSFRPGGMYNINLSAPVRGHKITHGAKLIVLFTDLDPEPDDSISPTSCGTMFLTDANLALVRQHLNDVAEAPNLPR